MERITNEDLIDFFASIEVPGGIKEDIVAKCVGEFNSVKTLLTLDDRRLKELVYEWVIDWQF